MQGIVQSVQTYPGGDYPLEAAPAGSTVLVFGDSADFDPSGGTADIDGVEVAYSSVDQETDVMVLAEPLAFAVEEIDFVATVPATESAHAIVALGDDMVMAEIPHNLKALLEPGERGPGEGEAVIVQEITPGTHRIMDVSGQAPALDARFVYNGDEMLLESKKRLGEKLAENDAAMTAAQGELSAAQQRIDDAFGQIDLKVDEAYVTAAKQQAIDAAAIDAQAKADEAESDAIAAAQSALTQAETDLAAAIASGDAAAIADAEAKIATAKAAAIDAAADDAAAKASAAQSAAEQTAQAALTQAQTDLQAAIASGDAAAIADAEAKIATAKQEAITAAANDATAKAGEAMQKANAALTAAQSAQATADNAIRTYYAETPPWADGTTQPDDVLGDMWYQDSTGQAYRWNGSEWKVIQDASIGEALAAAASAQTTADGKITAYYQPNEPLEGDEGDLWFDTDNDSAIHRRTGGDWSALLDPKALADAAEQAAKTAAAADATAKAEAAEAAAVQTAATDAQTKADAAEAAAEAAAKTYADTVASGASQSAIDTAAADAQAKADAAQAAAIAAAELDATAKAEAAEAAAAATAAADATAKADAAQQAAISAAVADSGDGANIYPTYDSGAKERFVPVDMYYSTYPELEDYVGRTVTIGVDIKTPVATTLYIYGYQGSGISINEAIYFDTTLDNEWERFAFTVTVKQYTEVPNPVQPRTDGDINIRDAQGGGIYTRNFKIELGGRATPWSPTSDAIMQAKADAAEAAAKADATAKADAAEQAAKAYALTTANGLAKTFWSTALPGTTQAPQDSTWYRHSGGKIISVFTQASSAVNGSAWQARPITSEAIDNLDVGKLTAASGTINSLVVNEFAAKLANIIEANIGNLTVTGDTHLEALVAEQIAGDTASFMELTVDQILAGYLQAQWIITEEGSIVAGDPLGARVEITSDGVRVYVVGPNGAPYEAVSMVNGEISFGVIGQDGTRLGGIASDGSVSGTSGSFSEDVRIKGLPLVGQLGGGVLPGWLDNLPRGIIAYNGRLKTTDTVATGSEFRYMKTTATLYPNRRYRVVAGARVIPNAPSSAIYLAIRHTLGSGLPTTANDPKLGPTEDGVATATQSGFQRVTPRYEGFISVGVEEVRSFVSTITGFYGATPSATSGFIYVEDVGPLVQESGSEGDGVGDVLYQSTWEATASRMYDKNGTRMAGRDNDIDAWFYGGTPTDFQGSAWIYGGGAEAATHGTELGKTLPQALLGSTIHKVEVYLRNKVWYGGVTEGSITLNTLASSTLPSTKLIEGDWWVDGFAAGEGIWIDLPVSKGWFTNGANRGLTLGDKDGKAFNGAGVLTKPTSGSLHGIDDTDPPLLRITYSR